MLHARTLIAGFLVSLWFNPSSVLAQHSSVLEPQPQPYVSATPAHMWEFGLHTGMSLGIGDIDFVPDLGGGIHVRRAIDYVFSVRGEALYAGLKNEDKDDGTTKTEFMSGTMELLASLNNLAWHANQKRKVNLYGLAGVGINRFKVEVQKVISPDIKSIDWTTQSHGTLGMGFAFRMSDRFNIGFESKAIVLFGKNSDRLDAVSRQAGDILSYSSLRLNFNLGNKEKKAEPLYWVNPMDIIMKDVTELKNRPVFDVADSDGDGVIDLIDQDNSTPPGVAVDTRGLPLDSDGDGIPNFEDDQPYIKQGIVMAQGSEPVATESDVERIVRDRLVEYDRTGRVPQPGEAGKGGTGEYTPGNEPENYRESRRNRAASLANWFLPLIHFDIDSDKIRYADYGNLSSIARVIKSNPDLRVVVTGFTDKTASEDYNQYLSYKRAQATINHLTQVNGIDRDRLVLQYNGEDDPLVPSLGSNLMNRRVEFRTAMPDEKDMEAPAKVKASNPKK